MDSVRSMAWQQENMRFFQQSVNKAIAYRLRLAQRETNNHESLERILPNLWESVRQSYQQKDWALLSAFRNALHSFLDLRGYWKQSLILNQWACEGALVLEDALSAARWAHDQANILHQRGEYDEAKRVYQESETAFRTLGETASALKSCHMRSLVLRAQGRYQEASELCEATIREAQELGLDSWLAHPLYMMGLLARDQRNMRQAEQWVEQSLALLTNQDTTHEEAMIAQCYHFLGDTALRQGDGIRARPYLMRSLHLSQQVGIMRRVAATQRVLGDLERRERHDAEAERLYTEALESVTRLGDQPELAKLYLARAKLRRQQGQNEEAILALRAALVTFNALGDARGIVGTSLFLGLCSLKQKQVVPAIQSVLMAIKVAHASGLLRRSTLRRWHAWWMLLALV